MELFYKGKYYQFRELRRTRPYAKALVAWLRNQLHLTNKPTNISYWVTGLLPTKSLDNTVKGKNIEVGKFTQCGPLSDWDPENSFALIDAILSYDWANNTFRVYVPCGCLENSS